MYRRLKITCKRVEIWGRYGRENQGTEVGPKLRSIQRIVIYRLECLGHRVIDER